MRSFFTAAVLLVAFLQVCYGIKCWQCDNAANDVECRRNGRLQDCRPDEDVCFTETRITDRGKLMTRRCKQQHACGNNARQNEQPDTAGGQCSGSQGSVCRCCCDWNRCNAKEATQCSLRDALVEIETSNDEDPTSHMIDRCPPLEAPENGEMKCKHKGGRDGLGTACRFICEKGFKLVGNRRSVCRAVRGGHLAAYNKLAPKCQSKKKIVKCPVQNNLRRVTKRCTNFRREGSTCSFVCQRENYTPEIGSIMENYCQADGTWSSPAPCCRLPCPPHTVMDLFIILDSSSSITSRRWAKMIKFVSTIVSNLTLDERIGSQVLVMRYNKVPDTENQVVFNSNENIGQIREKLNTIPYNGRNTYTGLALDYARTQFLKRSENRQNVPDVVLLMTDGRGEDNVARPAQALRSEGVEVFAIGVGQADQEELLQITGSKDKLWPSLNNFEALTVEAATKIGSDICKNSCT